MAWSNPQQYDGAHTSTMSVRVATLFKTPYSFSFDQKGVLRKDACRFLYAKWPNMIFDGYARKPQKRTRSFLGMLLTKVNRCYSNEDEKTSQEESLVLPTSVIHNKRPYCQERHQYDATNKHANHAVGVWHQNRQKLHGRKNVFAY